MSDQVIAACMREFRAHSGDCSGFVKAVGADVGVTIEGTANDIVDTLRAGGDWVELADGPAARASARAGKLVLAGLRGDEQAVRNAHGHVVVVVDGPLDRNLYPSAYWGQLGGTGAECKTINWAWTAQDRDRVTYGAHDLA
ncbi:hypothetical protein [Acidisphaera sp. S103]|uniref:hypothetical protein n=1 Tax=Acidisphaera sp. S103 TaxID=1747223 RepID=UPI00131E091A|nr:hypothetical protein [Acidisphaera sp. S103]